MLLYDVPSIFVAKCLACTSSALVAWAFKLTMAILAASLTLTVWDHVLTLGRELQLLWRWPWAPLQLLMLANRYGAILSMVFIVRSKSPYLISFPSSDRVYCQLFTGVSCHGFHPKCVILFPRTYELTNTCSSRWPGVRILTVIVGT